MATPRKHWFRAADSLAEEPWSNDELAALVRLMARMNSRRARNNLSAEQASTIVLSRAELALVTCRASYRRALSAMRAALSRVSATLTEECRSVKITWPNIAEFQGWHTRELPEDRPRVTRELPLPTPTPTPTPLPFPTPVVDKTPAPPATAAPVEPGLHPPLSDLQWNELRAWADAAVIAGKLDAKATDPSWLSGQVERCADYYAAKGKRIVRWPAAVRNWVRKSEELRAIYAPAKAEEKSVLLAFMARHGANGRVRT